MQRVLVIGAGGAGKSSFAARLSRTYGLPLIHLDALYWKPGWVETNKAEWQERVGQLVGGDRWVMDGNYGGTLDQRIAACDTVVFLDMPRLLCLGRALRRYVRHRGHSRPDMTAGCPERLSFAFLWWIWTYPSKRRPQILSRLGALSSEQRVVILRSDAEIDAFIGAGASA